jgi:adenine-specific DNA methylase
LKSKYITVLNYPGSKKRLLDFIEETIIQQLPEGGKILDIFAGTSSVGYALKDKYEIHSNDAEIYCSTIASALLNNKKQSFSDIKVNFLHNFNLNIEKLKKAYPEYKKEFEFIKNKDLDSLKSFYSNFLNVWQKDFQNRLEKTTYHLFTTYYSNSYFGLYQAFEIDSIRYAIDKIESLFNKNILLTALYYAMKIAVFSKDGHMAQPLNTQKNISVLIKRRDKSILESFLEKLTELDSDEFIISQFNNTVYNMNLEELLREDIIDKVDLIYADPPYTDMQYSRYFHILETVTKYDYPELSLNKGKISTGLYRLNRFQSPLSQHGKAKDNIEKLIKTASQKKKTLVFSYAYPVDIKKQKTDRYTISIDDLKELFFKYYGQNNTEVRSEEFFHSNNRNKESKAVYEYLIVGRPSFKDLNQNQYSEQVEKIKNAINKIDKMVGTNVNEVYNSQLYWSQKPFNICDVLIDELSTKDQLICDPFMGSGVTLIQSLRNYSPRRVVGIEVNDYPIFLVETLLQKTNLIELESEIKKINKNIDYLKEEYETDCKHCHTKTQLDKSLFNYDQNGNKVLQRVFYKCSCKKGQLEKEPDEKDIQLFKKHNLKEFVNFKNAKLIPNSRIAVKENQFIYDIFTSRNIRVLDGINAVINNSKFKDILLYALLGIIHLSKITDLKSSSQWPLWTTKKDCVEKNVINLFSKSLEKTLDSLYSVNSNYSSNRKRVYEYSNLNSYNYLILKEGTQNVDSTYLPDNSVDLVITDPPYLGQVIYSEYMQLYQPFLKNKIDYEKEIVVSNNSYRLKSENRYYKELDMAFNQISRFTKDGGILAMYFHDSSLEFWNKLISIMEKNFFDFIDQNHVKKSKITLKNIVSRKKSLNGDSLLFFIKKENIVKRKFSGNIEEKIIEIARDIIKLNNGKATTAELYDKGVLGFAIQNNLLSDLSKKYDDFTDIFIKNIHWSEEGFWY